MESHKSIPNASRSTLHALLALPLRILHWIMLTRPIRFTRFGTFYILFAIGVGAAAINTGNNLLYLILGILLGFIVISGFLSDSGLWGMTLEWRPIGSLYAGQKALFECQARKGWFPGVAVTIESHWQGIPPISCFAPWIPARGVNPLRIELTPKRRGYLTLESCHYSTRFPFGLFQKSHTTHVQQRWIVYPKLERLPGDFLERQGKDASRDSSSRVGLGSVPFILRDWRTGDALRQVHWKVSAKRQHLIVKETEEEANEGDLFHLHAWPTYMNEKEMDRFISFVASLIFAVYERGRPVGLAAPERIFSPDYSRQHLHRIFEFLALVDPFKSRGPSARNLLPEWNANVMDVLSLWQSYGRSVIPAVVGGNPSSWIPDRGIPPLSLWRTPTS